MMAPPAKISPVLMMQRFVAFDPLFALGLALVFKAISSLRPGRAREVLPSGAGANQCFPETKSQIYLSYGLLLSCAAAIVFQISA
jgi:hypothetical protein